MFRVTLAESASHLKSMYDKLGKKVDQARPFYETLNQTEHVRYDFMLFIKGLKIYPVYLISLQLFFERKKLVALDVSLSSASKVPVISYYIIPH